MPDPVEELLREWPELGAFGVEWVRAWAPHGRERLVKIAKVLRRYPWMAEVVRRRPVGNLHPYMVETYVAKDGSEVCISLNQLKAYCARGGEGGEAGAGVQLIGSIVLAKAGWPARGQRRGKTRPKGLTAYTVATM
ncbi:MAG: hypothetical protein RXN90_10440 [Thermoproteus sp.]